MFPGSAGELIREIRGIAQPRVLHPVRVSSGRSRIEAGQLERSWLQPLRFWHRTLRGCGPCGPSIALSARKEPSFLRLRAGFFGSPLSLAIARAFPCSRLSIFGAALFLGSTLKEDFHFPPPESGVSPTIFATRGAVRRFLCFRQQVRPHIL
jgi:hypothetical protein